MTYGNPSSGHVGGQDADSSDSGESAMPIIKDMELPIEPLKIDGPAVRGMNARKEENDNKQIEVAQLVAAYEPIKAKVIDGLKRLASITY